jgi:hypothetical protein
MILDLKVWKLAGFESVRREDVSCRLDLDCFQSFCTPLNEGKPEQRIILENIFRGLHRRSPTRNACSFGGGRAIIDVELALLDQSLQFHHLKDQFHHITVKRSLQFNFLVLGGNHKEIYRRAKIRPVVLRAEVRGDADALL